MYEAFYKLSSDPFRLLPDPEVCFPHRSCSKAWAYLRYALRRGEGIVVVTGQPGTGKTTLAERLLKELNPAQTVSARLIANDLNPTDLLRKLAYSFGLAAEGMDRAMLSHRIERYLIELEHSNRHALVLIDEAQTLSHQSLEAMRLLTDLQSRSRPVLQLFLLGQEGLEEVMCAPGMVQFQQRVIASCRLEVMDLAETKAYIEYRLTFADWRGDPSINGPAVMAVYRFSHGLPRHVNKICSRLLLHGCTEEKHSLKQRDVLTVVQDLREELLAPADEESDEAAGIEGTAFGSVSELALVPAIAPQAEEERVSNEELHSLFLAEEQLPRIDGGEVSQRTTNTGEGERWRRGGGPYAYRAGYPRPHRLRRSLRRLFQIPGLLGSWFRECAREWGPVVRDFVLRAGRRSVAGTARVGALIHARLSGGRLPAGETPKQPPSQSSLTVAGLGGVLVIGLAVVLWGRYPGPQSAVSSAQTQQVGHSALPVPAAEDATIGPLVLVGPSPRYLDAGELPLGAAEDLASGAGEARILAWAAAEVDPLAYRHGMHGESEQRLLGGLTANATEVLIGGAVNAVTTLSIWSLADQVPEADGQSSLIPRTAAEVSGTGEAGAGEASAATAEDRFTSSRAEQGRTDGSVADGQVAPMVADESDLSTDPPGLPPDSGARGSATGDFAMATTSSEPVAEPLQSIAVTNPEELPVAQGAGDMAVIAVVEAPVPDQVAEVEVAVDKSEVARLLALADWAIERDWLLRPKSESAYTYLQAVLAIDPQNRDALSGIDSIVSRYGQMARWALEEGSFDRAGRYVTRGLRVDPGNAEMLELRRDIDNAIAELEVAKLAVAEPVSATVDVAQPEPVVLPENNFDRLMRLVEGEN